MLFETLYTTKVPEELERAEYYQPQLEMQLVGGTWSFFVRERHGWFDDTTKKRANYVSKLDLNREERFSSYEKAKQRYDEQVRQRAAEGFVHSFATDPTSPDGVRYRRIGEE
jgi:hypothetical protein